MAKGKGSQKASKKPKEPDPESEDDDPPVEEEEEDEDDVPEGDDCEEADEEGGAEEGGAEEGEEEEGEEEEGEEEEGEDEEDEAKRLAREAKKAAKKKSNERASNIRKCKSAKSKGYRRLALMALTGSKKGTLVSHNRPTDQEDTFDTPVLRGAATDRYKNAFTLNAINRMCKFLPENTNAPSYGEDEFKLRTALHNESLGREAANVIRANLEPVVHKILTQTILTRWDAGGKPRIGAYDIHVATRALLPHLDVSASFPIGVIRNAQSTPEPKFKEATKIVNGVSKKYLVPKDDEKTILVLPTKEYEQQQTMKEEVKKMRVHARKVAEKKQKDREERKNKRQKGGNVESCVAACSGAAVAPIV